MKENLCLLCKENKATATGSHFVSACIVEGTYGERGKEIVHKIDLQTLTTKSYFGPSNLENQDTEIKENIIVKDFVFCQECEDLFGILESECCHPIRESLKALKSSSHKICRTPKGNKFFYGKSIRANVFQYFIYSLIWRQFVEHKLKGEVISIDQQVIDLISTELLKLKGLTHKAVRKMEIGFKDLDFTILTTYNKEDTTENPVMFNPSKTNPYQIFLGTLMLLFFVQSETSPNFELSTFLPKSLTDSELRFSSFDQNVKFGILNEGFWKKVVLNFYRKEIRKSL